MGQLPKRADRSKLTHHIHVTFWESCTLLSTVLVCLSSRPLQAPDQPVGCLLPPGGVPAHPNLQPLLLPHEAGDNDKHSAPSCLPALP